MTLLRPNGSLAHVDAGDIGTLKRCALLFDRVFTVSIGVAPSADTRDLMRQLRLDIVSESERAQVRAELQRRFEANTHAMGELLGAGVIAMPEWTPEIPLPKLYRRDDGTVFGNTDEASRMLAAEVERHTQSLTVPLIRQLSPLPDSTKSPVLHAVFREMPMPGAGTPWQAIHDWRADADANRLYARLRRWMTQYAKTGPSDRDAADEIAGMLVDYQTYMAVQHNKFVRGTLEIVLTAIAEAVESAVRLRFSVAVERLFALTRKETDLLESELSAPGREIAYLDTAVRKFA